LITPPSCSILFPYTTLFRSALKGAAHCGEALAMREPVGCDCDQDAGRNAEHPKHRPNENEIEHSLAAGKAVHDPTEKNGFSEREDRKSTRLNSSHVKSSYAV